MLGRHFKLKFLAAAVVTPNVLTGAIAHAGVEREGAQPSVRIEPVQQASTVIAQRREPGRAVKPARTPTQAQARAAIRAELDRMTTAQKKRLGKSRVEIEKIAIQSVAVTKCCGTFTGGVGCHGTKTFSGGITCCAITIKAN